MAGFVATVPMTLFMRRAHRHLPSPERYSLPPEQITHRVARLVGASAHPERPGWDLKTYAGHFAYGAACGAIYAAMANRRRRSTVASAERGMLFGVGVWAASYLGWLPAARILPPATDAPARRNALMIVAHLIWGAATALLADRTRSAPVERMWGEVRGDKPARVA